MLKPGQTRIFPVVLPASNAFLENAADRVAHTDQRLLPLESGDDDEVGGLVDAAPRNASAWKVNCTAVATRLLELTLGGAGEGGGTGGDCRPGRSVRLPIYMETLFDALVSTVRTIRKTP
ncbi:hypothetical protein ACVBEG_27820 [Pseudomonas sp. GG8]